jgi:hypothetical protein
VLVEQVQPLGQVPQRDGRRHHTGLGGERAGDGLQQRGLAGPVGAEQRDAFWPADLQVHHKAAAQTGGANGEDGAAGRDRGVGQVDADLLVVADGLPGLGQALPCLLQPLDLGGAVLTAARRSG